MNLALHWSRGRWRTSDVLLALAYVVSYVLLDWLSYVQPILQLGITPWSPQAGLTLTYLMSCGYRRAWLTLVAAFIAEALVRDAPAALPVVLLASAAVAAGYALAAYLLRPGPRFRSIESPVGMVWLLAVSATTTLAVAMLYVWIFTAADLLPASEAVRGVRRYWLGDLNGILTLAPPLLAASRYRLPLSTFYRRRWEVLAQLTALVLAMWVVFGGLGSENVRLFYLLFLPVIWIAFRWGASGAACCALAVQLGLVIIARGEAPYPPVPDLQLLMVTLETTGLLLGVVVTEHAAALRQLDARVTEQRAILNTAPDGILSTDTTGRILSANAAAMQLFKASESRLLLQSLASCLPKLQLHAEQGRGSVAAQRLDGTSFPADVAWAKVEAPATEGFILVVRDASERLSNESQLRERDTALARATRFAMLGELASALTHELNQPITALVSYLRASQILAAQFESQDARLPQTLSKATNEAIRTSVVLRRLRDFYRGSTPKLVALSLEAAVTTTLQSFEERLRQSAVQVQSDFASGLPSLQCDQTQLEMILVNLLGNAVDAVVQQPEGQRRILLTASHHGNEVLLAIEDSGPGLAADVQARLFDPFVTTKPDGMGLGLAISRSLLRSQGGEIWTQPSRLGGACFVIRLSTTAVKQMAL